MGGITNVKRGDSDASWKLNMDLTGSTSRVLARSRVKPETVITLTSEITDATNGIVTAQVSELDVGSYDIEVEVNQFGKTYSFPDKGYGSLSVNADLG